MAFWQKLKNAFAEGYEEERAGAPIAALLDVMMLAARADRDITDHELRRVAALLRRHLHTFSSLSDGALERHLRDSLDRLDALGDEQAQLAEVARAITTAGTVAVDEAYALAYAVLLSDDGLNAPERAFATGLMRALGMSGEAARGIEHDLEAALRPSADRP